MLTVYLFPIKETKTHWACDHPELRNLFGQKKTQTLKRNGDYKLGMLAIINFPNPFKRFHFIKDLSDWRYQAYMINYGFHDQLDGIVDFRTPPDPMDILLKWRTPTS